jgi:hypothetical protein
MANITITVDRNFLGQLLESAEARAEQYEATADFLESGEVIDGVDITDDHVPDEARDTAEFIRRAISAVRSQLEKAQEAS